MAKVECLIAKFISQVMSKIVIVKGDITTARFEFVLDGEQVRELRITGE